MFKKTCLVALDVKNPPIFKLSLLFLNFHVGDAFVDESATRMLLD